MPWVLVLVALWALLDLPTLLACSAYVVVFVVAAIAVERIYNGW